MGNRPSSGSHADDLANSRFTVDPNSPHVKRILEAREKLTGWERVKLIFLPGELGDSSPELTRIIGGLVGGVIVGVFIGSMGRGRIAYENFLRSNKHEIFESPLTAKRKLQDNVTLGMFSGAYRIGWRLGLFTGMFMFVSTVVSTYRGKNGMLDQIAGAGAAGFLYKFHQGPKASLAGAVIGCSLGVCTGIISLGIAKLSGNSLDNLNLYYYQRLAKKEADDRASLKSAREFLETSDDPDFNPDRGAFLSLANFHDKLLERTKSERKQDTNTQVQITDKHNKTNQAQVNVSKMEVESNTGQSPDLSNPNSAHLVSSENKNTAAGS